MAAKYPILTYSLYDTDLAGFMAWLKKERHYVVYYDFIVAQLKRFGFPEEVSSAFYRYSIDNKMSRWYTDELINFLAPRYYPTLFKYFKIIKE